MHLPDVQIPPFRHKAGHVAKEQLDLDESIHLYYNYNYGFIDNYIIIIIRYVDNYIIIMNLSIIII